MAGGVLCVCVGFYVRVVSSLFLFLIWFHFIQCVWFGL